MELLQLRYFYESAKNENFSQTAKMFMVPTTSVSASIKRLEQELGCQLFDRTSNKIRLNAKGQRLQQTLCSVFHDINETVEQLSDNNQDKRQIKILVRSMRRKVTDAIIHRLTTSLSNYNTDTDNFTDLRIALGNIIEATLAEQAE